MGGSLEGKMRLWLQAPLNFVGVVDLESSLKQVNLVGNNSINWGGT